MSAIDWVCKKLSLESASGQLSAITISGQHVSVHLGINRLPAVKLHISALSDLTLLECRSQIQDGGYVKQSLVGILCVSGWTFTLPK